MIRRGKKVFKKTVEKVKNESEKEHSKNDCLLWNKPVTHVT